MTSVMGKQMNLRDEILKEHSKKQTMKIVKYIGTDQKRFDELLRLFLADEYRVTQRAAWALSYCAIEHPELIQKHLKKIILNLEKPVHVAVKRNTLRFIQFVQIPRTLQGRAAEICFRFLNDLKEPIAIRVFAMSVLANICQVHPELSNELRLSIEAQLPYGSAGVHSRAKKVLKSLKAK